MPTVTTRPIEDESPQDATLHVAFDLGNTEWTLACTTAAAVAPRVRTMPARDLPRLVAEFEAARRHFGLLPAAPIRTCYEAGRDGFWLHRALAGGGIPNVIVDSASIEVNRRARQAKTDRLDATALLRLLLRYTAGETHVWRVVHVPTVDEEDRRHTHRELVRLTREHTRSVNRIKGLLAGHGVRLTTLRRFPVQLPQLRQWDGTALPPGVCVRLETTWARLLLVRTQRKTLVTARRALLESSRDPAVEMVRQLLRLKGIGEVSARLFAMEFFSWRRFGNRREVGALAGPAPIPRRSGDAKRDAGISKAGNGTLRARAVELTWGWLRWQPTSELSMWYRRRYATGGARLRRIGIVALARRLLIALWRYVAQDQIPTGATLKA
ncbi:MAG: IS110 family transposase [Gemmatimonadaceae bacterium]|nr:IS110 family transposase [Gemmatimonadaceae bacterium]